MSRPSRPGRSAEGADDGLRYGSIGEMMRKVSASIKRPRKELDGGNLSINPREWKEHGQKKR